MKNFIETHPSITLYVGGYFFLILFPFAIAALIDTTTYDNFIIASINYLVWAPWLIWALLKESPLRKKRD